MLRISLFLLLIVVLTFDVNAGSETIEGIWQTEGYGYILEITTDAAIMHQVTAVSCIEMFYEDDFSYNDDEVFLESVNFNNTGTAIDLDIDIVLDDDLVLIDAGTATPIIAHRLSRLPIVCETGIIDSDDPEDVFETFWHVFNEQYAFFDIYDVDWDAQYDIYRPLVKADSSDSELFDILADMVAPLEDGHINLTDGRRRDYSPGVLPEWTEDDDDVVESYFDVVLEDYLDDDYEEVASDYIIYGHLSDTVGYIALLSMEGFSDDFDDLDDIDVLAEIMPEIIDTFIDKEIVIIDVRFNDGGDDINSLHIAGYFTNEVIPGFSKQARSGNGSGTVHEAFVYPQSDRQFTEAVYLLTSGYTASAAEIFVGSMTSLSYVKLVGEPTAGELSDTLISLLPNGWSFTLSNEMYIFFDGELYEGRGIPPHVEIEFDSRDRDEGDDRALDIILELDSQ